MLLIQLLIPVCVLCVLVSGQGRPTSVNADCECGQEELPVQTRVRNGKQLQRHRYPWMISILSDRLNCAGTLITDRHVLTAAHCVRNRDISQLRVVLGAHTETERFLKTAFPVQSAIVHPDADGYVLNDVAIVELKDPLIEDLVKPICLPKSGLDLSKIRKPFLTGWGTTMSSWQQNQDEGMLGAKTLRRVRAYAFEKDKCSAGYGPFFDDNKLCYGSKCGRRIASQGDGGGPLAFKQGGRVYQMAISAEAQNLAALARFPDMFESLDKHLPFIFEHTKTGTYCNNPKYT